MLFAMIKLITILVASAALPTVAPLSAQDTLHVLWHSPSDTTGPSSVVTVMFDRPVAPALDSTILAASVFHIEPAIAGTAVWRDPVTIRFVPSSPLQPGTRYTITIDARLKSTDGSRIATPSSFAFRVFGPRLLERSFDAYRADTLAPDGRVQLLYSAPIDLARLERGARLELTGCPGAGVVALHARQRPLRAGDSPRFQYAGGAPTDSFTARFRTVVELEPVTTLPVECPAKIVIPTTNDELSIGKEERYSLHTVAVARALRFGCLYEWDCNPKMLALDFASPMRRTDIARLVRLNGKPVVIEGQAQREKRWVLRVDLVPRTTYTIAVDSAIRDAYDRPLTGSRELTAVTGDFKSRVLHAVGIITVPRSGAATFPLRSMNVRSVKIIGYRVPDSARVPLMSMAAAAYDPGLVVRGLAAETTLVELPDRLNVDTTTEVPLPRAALAPDHPMVFVQAIVAERLPDAYAPRDYDGGKMIALPAPDRGTPWRPPYTVVQLTDLAVTARLAAVADGAAFVTGLIDGQPRENVSVTQIDQFGRVVARGTSNTEGIASLARVALDSALPPRTPVTPYTTPRFTVLQAESRDDRVVVSLGGRAIGYRSGSPLTLESLGGRLDDSPLAAGALFFDRDIFRPGEMLHVKGVVRRGMLGALSVPEPTDSVRLVVRRQQYTWADDSTLVIRDTVMRPSSFGTIVDSVQLRAGLPLSEYRADLSVVAGTQWRRIQTASFKIAEYRAPEFVVTLTPDSTIHFSGDTVTVGIEGRYLFDAPMRRAIVHWTAEATPDYSRDLRVPDGWNVGGWAYWLHADNARPAKLSGTDTLDRNGRAGIRIPAASPFPAWAAALIVQAAVVDITNQTVSAEIRSGPIYSGRVFAASREDSSEWRVGKETFVDVRAIDARGTDVRNAVVRALVLRHRLIPENNQAGLVAHWVVDTLRRTELRPRGGIARLSFTPDSAGEYAVDLAATDSRGGVTRTNVVNAVGKILNTYPVAAPEPVGYRTVIRVEKSDLEVGQEARVHFDSPFDDAEAWITIEREGIIEQRRERAHRGDNTVSLAVQARYAPNVWVSVVLTARGEKTRPDSAMERLRAGYAELRVTPSGHRLVVRADVERSSYAPRDTATIRVRVADAVGRGVRSEVALWAVDVGVVSMTQMRSPDLIRQLYAGRGVGGQLWSTLPTMLTTNPWLVATFLDQATVTLNAMVATRYAAATSGNPMIVVRSSVGSAVSKLPEGSARSDFASTPFFIGNAQTDDSGAAVIRARVPDNLTTFHVYAVAVSMTDQYGTGDAELLVTKPLVARAALPRFVRPTDSLRAGVVVTARDGRPGNATVNVAVSGAALGGPARASVSLSSSDGQRANFVVRVPSRDAAGDSVSVRFDAVDGARADAVETRLPVRPDYHARTHAVLGATRDSQTVTITLPADIDPIHSRLRLRIGTSRLSAMLASYRWFRAYPYDCTEQLSSVGRGIVAVWEATKGENREALGGDPRAKLQEIADEISRRQRGDGAFRYWPTWDWSSAWLTAYAGSFLLEARDLGVSVSPGVIKLAATYLTNVSRASVDTGGMNRFEQRDRRLALGGRIAAVEFLRRAGSADTAAEGRLIRVAAAMTWEDRLRIAEVVASRRDLRAAADSIVDAAWREVTIAGHRVDLPDSANGPREFPSRVAPAARLLSASLELRPAHPLLAALVETVLQQGRAESRFAWSTQDYASLVMALAHFGDGDTGGRIVNARAGNQRFVARPQARGVDTSIVTSLSGLLETSPTGKQVLRLHVETSPDQRPVYFALEVVEVPRAAPVTPDIQGIVVERWYERFDDGKPVTRVNEGDLVRVRLRVTVPADRAFVALEDPLPAGLEPVDTGLRTSGLGAFAANRNGPVEAERSTWQGFLYGRWDGGRWSPWEHQELHDDRVSYFARVLWTGSYTASYIARATTAGSFVAPPAYAEEMYNPALQGRTGGMRFLVGSRP